MRKILILSFHLLLLPQLCFAGAWSQKHGHVGIKISYFSLVSDARFSTGGGLESRCLIDKSSDCFLHTLKGGVKIPVFSDIAGSVKSRAIFITLDYGLFERIELSTQIGFFSSENDFEVSVPASISTDAEGFSDLRVKAKYQYIDRGKIVAAVSAGFKAPTGEFNSNAFGVSLGEGGWDYQISHEFGISLWPLPIYANVMAGYRWRLKNEAEIDLGDEFLFNLEAGVNVHKNVLFKVAYFGFNAKDDLQNLGIGQPNTPGRKINFLSFTMFLAFADFAFEAGAEHSLSGRNYISGTKLNLGLSRDFKLL